MRFTNRFIGLSMGLLLTVPGASSNASADKAPEAPVVVQAKLLQRSALQTSTSKLAGIEQTIAHHTVTPRQIEELGAFILQNPNDSFARYLMARCFEQKGYILLAAEQDELAAAAWQDPQSVLELFKHHIEEGDTKAAFPMSQLIYHKFPSSPYRPFMDALFHEEYGRRELALPVYEKLVARNDRPLGAATRLSAFHLEQGNFPRVLELTGFDLSVRPDYMPALVARAEALLRLGRAQEAARMLEPHINTNPFSQRLTVSLYRTLSKIGRYEDALGAALRNLAMTDSAGTPEAIKRVRKIMDMLPEPARQKVISQTTEQVDKTEYAAKFHLRMGDIFLAQKKPALALAQYQESLYYNDELEPPRLRVGVIMERYQRKYPEAMNQYEKVKLLTVGDRYGLSIARLRKRLGNRSRDTAWRIQDALAAALGLNLKDEAVVSAHAH